MPLAGEETVANLLSGAGVGERTVRGGALRAGGFIASNLLGAAGAVVVLRYLGIADFGRYGTVMALVAIVQGVTDAGLSVTGTRELSLASSPAERRRLLSHLIGLRIALTGGGVACAVGFAVIAGYDSTLVTGTAIAGVGVFVMSVQSAMLIPLSVDLRNGALTVNELTRQGLLVVAFVTLALAGAQLLAFFAVQLAVGLALLALTPALLYRRDLVRPRWTSAALRELAAIAVPVAIASMLAAVYFRVLVVIMSLLSDSPEEIGYFVTSTRIFELVAALPFMLAVVVLPVATVAARDDPARLRYLVQQMTELMALGGVVVVVAIVLGAEPILRILGGDEYVAAAPVLRIQSLALLTLFAGAAWTPVLVAMGRQASVALATGVGLLIAVVGGVVLVPPLEAVGAAVAAAVADLFVLVAAFALLRRAGPGMELRFGFAPRLAAATVAALAVGLVPGVPAVADALAAVLVLVAAALALRIVPRDLVHLLPRRARR